RSVQLNCVDRYPREALLSKLMAKSILDLDGHTAVVVGGTSGIGLTLALGLADAGANVIATGRRAELVQAAAAQIESRGRRSLVQTADVSTVDSLQQFLNAVLAEFSSVEILVNCAGRTKRRSTLEVPESEWNEIMDTNLTGTLRSCQVFGRHMIERK